MSSSEGDSIPAISETTVIECKCVLESLFERPFSERNFNEKYSIVSNGRPTPLIPALTYKTKTCTRHLTDNNYKMIHWLCGCIKTAKLYCWPCMLFATEKTKWTTSGVSDLNNLCTLTKRHELSQCHIHSLVTLKSFSKTRIEFALSEQFKVNMEKYNEIVKQNRYIVKCLIDVACFLAENDLPHIAYDKSYLQSNRGNFAEVVTLLRSYDGLLDNHIRNSPVFTRLSNNIQNDLIVCISQILLTRIKNEINDCNFVALSIDETDVLNKCQLSILLRYVDSVGEIQERFIGLYEFNETSANALAQFVFSILEEYKCESKLIAQSYNGTAVLSREHGGIQTSVKSKCKQALFIPCFFYETIVVLRNSVDHIKVCKLFFHSLFSLANFFSKLPKRAFVLDQVVKCRLASVEPIKWDYNSKLISNVINYKEEVRSVLKIICINGEKWDTESYIAASGLLTNIEDFNFNFFLKLFNIVFPYADHLIQMLRNRSDIAYYKNLKNNFKKDLYKIRNDFNDFWAELIEIAESCDEPPEKKLHTDAFNNKKSSYQTLYYSVIDTLKDVFLNRYRDFNNLEFISLLDTGRFAEFSENFPSEYFSSLKTSYRRYFDYSLLKSELSVVYKSEQFRKNCVFDLLKYFQSMDLTNALPQVWKLINLVITIPVTNGSEEKLSLGVNKIKSYFCNTQAHNWLTSEKLVMSIEKILLKQMKVSPKFYDDVIDLFAQKPRHIELIYKL